MALHQFQFRLAGYQHEFPSQLRDEPGELVEVHVSEHRLVQLRDVVVVQLDVFFPGLLAHQFGQFRQSGQMLGLSSSTWAMFGVWSMVMWSMADARMGRSPPRCVSVRSRAFCPSGSSTVAFFVCGSISSQSMSARMKSPFSVRTVMRAMQSSIQRFSHLRFPPRC